MYLFAVTHLIIQFYMFYVKSPCTDWLARGLKDSVVKSDTTIADEEIPSSPSWVHGQDRG
jgi:hypothetical protein